MHRPPLYNPRIASFVAQVSKTALTANILALQNFVTRYASYPGCEQAGDYLYGYFSALGLRTEFDPFAFSSRSSRNIVATIPGTALPEYVVIVCAHYDSTTGSATGPTLAPGADDNASGTAAVMEIARILAGRSFDFTLKFVCFSAEEWGLYGSKHYAQEAWNAGEKILGVLNMDMIAYTDALPEDLNVFTNDTSKWLGSWFVLCARQYAAVDLAIAANPGVRASDHSPFWDQGYSALLAIEDYPLKNPYYHKTTDVLATLNLDFAAAVTKIVLAVACRTGPAGPSVVEPAFGLPLLQDGDHVRGHRREIIVGLPAPFLAGGRIVDRHRPGIGDRLAEIRLGSRRRIRGCACGSRRRARPG